MKHEFCQCGQCPLYVRSSLLFFKFLLLLLFCLFVQRYVIVIFRIVDLSIFPFSCIPFPFSFIFALYIWNNVIYNCEVFLVNWLIITEYPLCPGMLLVVNVLADIRAFPLVVAWSFSILVLPVHLYLRPVS